MDKFAWTEKLLKLKRENEALKESDRMLKRIEFLLKPHIKPGEKLDGCIERLIIDRWY